MRGRWYLPLACVVAIAALTTRAQADLSASAVVHVRVTVLPIVAVTPVASDVDLGTIAMGDVVATVNFIVSANKQDVSFQVAASALYKGDDPNGQAVAPIPLNLGAGAAIQPLYGSASSGHSNILAYVGAPGPIIRGYPTTSTETVQFSSSQNNRFSQAVTVKVTWTQSNPEQATGQYGGIIQLTALVLP